MNLSVKDGCFSYKHNQEHVLLKNINLSVDSGDLLAILGPNGAGKTTLLRNIMGFLHWNSGHSFLDGTDIRTIPYRKLWKSVAYVPQAKHVTTSYTVEEMVLIGRSSHLNMLTKPREKDLSKVYEVMERLHISKLADKKCSEISGGELQMVLMARALAAEPQILILDEPESNLDFRNQLLILETMSDLVANGMSCIFNTHYPAHALQRANKAFILQKNGEYVFGDVNSVVTEQNIEQAFGVKAVIGEIETPCNILQDIVPLRVLSSSKKQSLTRMDCLAEQRLAVLSIIANDNAIAERINQLLHKHSQYVIGRMGMPYPDCGVFIINVTLDAPQKIVQAIQCKLQVLPGVSVKTTYAPQNFAI